jgi:isopentenyl-diphosphate delta-isomerase
MVAMADDPQSGATIVERKDHHLKLALEERVEVPARGHAGWAAIRLVPRALPELALADVDPSVTFLGKRLAFPLLVGSMTGGTAHAGMLNRRLARAAARAGVGMGLGSQRVMLARPETAATFAVRDDAPALPLLIANVGAVQLNYGVTHEALARLVGAVSADALVLHLNAAQEAVQPEGDTDFRGLAAKMRALPGALGVPVGVKEVGQGFTRRDVRALVEAAPGVPRLAFIESAGAGGTSWTLIEGKRAPDAEGQALGALFADWGVPAVTSLLACVEAGRGTPVVASGGIRSGLDAARAIALGASMTAMALPLLKAAAESEDRAFDVLMGFRRAFVTAMFLVGARTVEELGRAPHHVDHRLLPARWEGGEVPPVLGDAEPW